MLHQFRQLSDRKVGPAFGYKTRIVPDDLVTFTTIASGSADKVDRVVAVAIKFDPEFLLRNERRDRLLPGFRPFRTTNVADVGELPERILPCFDIGDGQLLGCELLAKWV